MLNNFESFKVFKGSYFYIDFPDEKEIEKTINNEINKICFNKNFNKDVKIGDNILIENGSIITEVETRDKYGVLLKVIEPGEGTIHKYMSVNVPGVYLNVDRLTSKDMEVIKFGLDKGVEQIALSFVRDQIDVKNCYDFMKNYSIEKSQNTELCLKIEDKFGVQNLNEILDYVKSENIKSSVMVARGDLFVELKNEELPFAQEYIIETCKKYDVPVIVGTGILSSMQHCSKPTRSEICDVYGMLKSGVNNFMLSGETSFGDNPALVVKTLNDITKRYYDDSKLKT
jgi:pyruvate kinase